MNDCSKIKMKRFIIALVILILTISFLVLKETNTYDGPICCIMITGKDEKRLQYARKSINNFLEQTYKNKLLVIINHHKKRVSHDIISKHVFEFHVDKDDSMTLGDLRNIALQLVPHNASWTTWDDDDYRQPTYLEYLASFKKYDNIVAISQRIDYNSNNDMSWVCHKFDGFVLFLAPFDNRLKYMSRDSLEDINILEHAKDLGYKIKVVRNNPCIYVRLIHTTNTSLYVKPMRHYLVKGPNYSERFTSQREQVFIDQIKHKFVV